MSKKDCVVAANKCVPWIYAPEDMQERQLNRMQKEVEQACEKLLDALQIKRDHNTEETPKRMAKMFVREVFAGRYTPEPKITLFPNVKGLQNLYTVGPVTVRSCCSHHFVPIMGQAWFGIISTRDSKLMGLSKFSRIANWFFNRPQIQEEATQQLGDWLQQNVGGAGIGLVVRAKHFCTVWRGIKDTKETMITSFMHGVLNDDAKARAEFFEAIKAQGF